LRGSAVETVGLTPRTITNRYQETLPGQIPSRGHGNCSNVAVCDSRGQSLRVL